MEGKDVRRIMGIIQEAMLHKVHDPAGRYVEI
jgi:hypothetical protein